MLNMMQNKELLLRDLCARLPYKVKIKFVFNKDIEKINNLIYVSDNEQSYIHNSCMILTEDNIKYVFNDWLDECKPYLRPLSSMTEEEVKEFYEVECMNSKVGYIKPTLNWHFTIKGIDWLLKHHFDFRGLIPMGLALVAPEEMYE